MGVANDYTDQQVAAGVTQANDYTDTRVAAGVTQANAYAEGRAAAALSAAQSYADAGDAATLARANGYTDGRFQAIELAFDQLQANRYTDQRLGAITQAFDQLQLEVWDRFDQTDKRISRTGAMNSAMAQMSAAAAAIERSNRIAVGVGYQDGYEALAVGFQRAVRDNVTVTFGASISGGERSVSSGLGVGW